MVSTLPSADPGFVPLTARDIEHQNAWDNQTERVRREILEDLQDHLESSYYYDITCEDELLPPRRRRNQIEQPL